MCVYLNQEWEETGAEKRWGPIKTSVGNLKVMVLLRMGNIQG